MQYRTSYQALTHVFGAEFAVPGIRTQTKCDALLHPIPIAAPDSTRVHSLALVHGLSVCCPPVAVVGGSAIAVSPPAEQTTQPRAGSAAVSASDSDLRSGLQPVCSAPAPVAVVAVSVATVVVWG